MTHKNFKTLAPVIRQQILQCCHIYLDNDHFKKLMRPLFSLSRNFYELFLYKLLFLKQSRLFKNRMWKKLASIRKSPAKLNIN